ncbi:hypothetical protein Pfo_015248 [Paulownia fortunei]|nr:hypothetical protein Pfo_015248 [Paulownia fortunei]
MFGKSWTISKTQVFTKPFIDRLYFDETKTCLYNPCDQTLSSNSPFYCLSRRPALISSNQRPKLLLDLYYSVQIGGVDNY